MEEKTPTEILEEIIEKYNLGPSSIFGNPELRKMLEEKSREERLKIIEELPLYKLAQIHTELEKGKIRLEDLASEIKRRLKISSLKSEQIAKEMIEKFGFKKVGVEIPEEKKKIVKDIYREPIE